MVVASHFQSLIEREAFILISFASLVSYAIFKRFELHDPLSLLVLLILVPGALNVALPVIPQNSVFSLIVTFTIYLSILCVSIILYRISPFHPLAGYPGPLLDKISKIYTAFVGNDGGRHIYLAELHRRYGDVVRIGPNEISICDPSAIGPLLGTQGLPKGPQWEGRLMKTSVPNLIAMRDQEAHLQRRKHWARGLNTAALKTYEPIIANRARQLVEHLGNTEGQETDLSRWFGFFSYDFMTDMAFGGGSEMMRDGDTGGILELLENGLARATFFGHVPWIARYGFKIRFLTKDLLKFRRFGENEAKRRKSEGSLTKDLFYHLMDEGGVEKKPPSFAQIIADGILAIVAGSDTTAIVLSNLFYFLVTNEKAHSRLRAEVDKLYPPDEDALSTKHHSDMHYLTACINETMRLTPPVPSGSQRRGLKGSGDKMIGPYLVPEGTAVLTPFYVMQHDSRNFSPNPEAFWPERWIIANNQESAPKGFIHNMEAFTPFSYGPANCVGKYLAMQEMRLVVCALIQTLDVKKADGFDPLMWKNGLKDFFVMKRGSLPVLVKRRR